MGRKSLQAYGGGFVELVPPGPALEGRTLSRFQLCSTKFGTSV